MGEKGFDPGKFNGIGALCLSRSGRIYILDQGNNRIQVYRENERMSLVTDNCPNDPNKTDPGACGCGVPDVDTDGDGTLDCKDGCPNDPNKTQPGSKGCGVPEESGDTGGGGGGGCFISTAESANAFVTGILLMVFIFSCVLIRRRY